jgi:hypothetical protein
LHKTGKHATQITSEASYVKAEGYVRNTNEFKANAKVADSMGEDRLVMDGVSLENIYGASYKNHVFGKTRVGSAKNPTGSIDTDFTNGTITAVYKKDTSGQWNLLTLYPNPQK